MIFLPFIYQNLKSQESGFLFLKFKEEYRFFFQQYQHSCLNLEVFIKKANFYNLGLFCKIKRNIIFVANKWRT